MTEFRIFVDISDTLPLGSALDKTVFPNLAHAVQRLTEAAYAKWQSYAQGETLPDGRSINVRTGGYLRSIQMRMLNDFNGEVFSELPYASAIENGMPERDLKRILGSSYKVRVNAKGKRYLIIPFRHFTPGSVQRNTMPQAVHDWWQDPGREYSRITGQYERLSGTGAFDIRTRERLTVPGWRYKWGSRLGKGDLEGMGLSKPQVKRLQGMVNFRETDEGARHSQYITFRVIAEDSKGWRAPAVEAYRPAKTVAEQLQPVAEEAFREALKADIQGIFTAA